MTCEEIKKSIVGIQSWECDDCPREDEVEVMADWLNAMVERGVVCFKQVSGDFILMVAFSKPVTAKDLRQINDQEWSDIHYEMNLASRNVPTD